MKKNKLIKYGFLLLILAAIPFSVNLVQKNQENRSQASGGYDDSDCDIRNGVCLENSQKVKEGESCKVGSKDGEFVFGLCGGGIDRRCCVPVSTVSDSGDSSKRLKVATFNIGHANKTSRASSSSIASEINEHDFNIVGLQEVNSSTSLTKTIAGKTSMDYFHTSTSAGNAIIGKGNLNSNSSVRLTNCGNDSYRAIQKTVVRVNNKNVSFYNVHIDFNSGCRKTQALDVLEIIRKDPNPYILVGDFNFGKSGCGTSDDIFKDDHLIIYDSNSGTRCTDMIIYSKNRGMVKVSSNTYNTRGEISDHNLVTATFEIN